LLISSKIKKLFGPKALASYQHRFLSASREVKPLFEAPDPNNLSK
jgi:hypothetical protein